MGLLNWLFGIHPIKSSPATIATGWLFANRSLGKSKKRSIHSIGFYDETIHVTWNDQKNPDRYKMTPFRHNSFLDSGEFYLIGRYLEQEPKGFEVKFNDELFKIIKIQ